MARKKRRTSLGVLFWVAFILLVIVVFMVNRPRIQTVLENTGLVDVISNRISGDGNEDPEITSEDGSDGEGESVEPLPDGLPGPEQQPDDTQVPPAETQEPDDVTETDAPVVAEEPADGPDEDEDREEEEDAAPSTPPESDDGRADSKRSTRQARLYFVRVTDDGAFPEPVTRTIEYNDRPLTRTIEALLEGPNGNEGANGLLNLIPDGTQLRSARVSNGVAYLDFNEAFRFNQMGVEGYRMQLKQIVFATTEFQSVDRVQILIDGERREWLGGEGVYIGTPIGRDSLS